MKFGKYLIKKGKINEMDLNLVDNGVRSCNVTNNLLLLGT